MIDLRNIVAVGALLASCSAALAQYPDRPIEFIVPYGAGGGADMGVRIAQPYLEACLGQDIVVVNLPGAGGVVGMTELAAREPDGYTLGSLLTPNLPVGAIATDDPSYDVDSFDYLANFVASRVAVSANRQGRFESLDDLIETAQNEPVQAAISSLGNDDHLLLLQLAEEAGITLKFIPMIESPAARNAVMGGHVEILGLSVTESANFKEQLRTLAVAGTERFHALPEVPTFMEEGYDLVAGNTFLMGAPAGLPDDIHATLDRCFQEVAANPEYRREVEERNLIYAPMNAEEADAFVRSEFTKLERLWERDPWIEP